MEWINDLGKLKYPSGTPLTYRDDAARIANNIMIKMREVDPAMLAFFCTDQGKLPSLMKNVAYMIEQLGTFASTTSSQADMLRMAHGCRQIGASAAACQGAFDATSYQQVYHRELPKHVDSDQFNEAIKLGIPIGEIVNTRDVADL